MFSRYRNGLEQELRAAMLHSRPDGTQGDLAASLYRMLDFHMGWADELGEPLAAPVSQGKALRPTLCLFSCHALSGDWARALPVAASLEIIHNFSLIHDDIQDGDLERRHQPTVWALWGQPQALVAGNAMRSVADKVALGLMERCVPQDRALKASVLLTRGYLEMTKGQCLDLAFESSVDIGLDDYLSMISRKTGALIRCGMEAGALIGSDEEAYVSAFARCGGSLGLAFQVRDDVLGIWGEGTATGKGVGNDIRRKKKSFPIVYALEASQGVARQRLVDAYGKTTMEDGDVDDVLAVLEELKAHQRAEEVTREHANLALQELRRVPLPSWVYQELEELVDFITARNY